MSIQQPGHRGLGRDPSLAPVSTLPGLPMPCWRVRSGPELVRWLGKGKGPRAAQPGDSTWLPDHSSLLHPASHGSAVSAASECCCCCCFQIPACISIGVGEICPVGTQESCKTPPALSRGAQSPIPCKESRSSSALPRGPHSPFSGPRNPSGSPGAHNSPHTS